MASKPKSVTFRDDRRRKPATTPESWYPARSSGSLRRGLRQPVLVNVNGYEFRGRRDGRQAHDQHQRRRPQRYGPERAETRSA